MAEHLREAEGDRARQAAASEGALPRAAAQDRGEAEVARALGGVSPAGLRGDVLPGGHDQDLRSAAAQSDCSRRRLVGPLMSSERAPYPGLRSFKREETDIFFGRDNCVDAMVERLAAKRFLAVLGSSGTGKSSLVNTGLLAGLEMGLVQGAGSRWRIVDFRPGDSPLRNLARRVLGTAGLEGPEGRSEPDDVAVSLLRARFKRGPRSLIEWCREGNLPAGTNLLLLVDQFEELFRYQDYAGREEAEAFVALLLESRHPTGFANPNDAELPIYVVLTMRSEYLGYCSLFEGLAEAINE